jgi:hypothetical protein
LDVSQADLGEIIRVSRTGGTPGTGGIGVTSPGPSGRGLGLYADGTVRAYFFNSDGVSLGSYARASLNPPTDGLIVAGNVGIGNTNPLYKL